MHMIVLGGRHRASPFRKNSNNFRYPFYPGVPAGAPGALYVLSTESRRIESRRNLGAPNVLSESATPGSLDGTALPVTCSTQRSGVSSIQKCPAPLTTASRSGCQRHGAVGNDAFST